MNMSHDSLGILETRGLAAAIFASDAMLKCASVAICHWHLPGSGRVTVLCSGDLASCQAAIAAGEAVAAQSENLLAATVIARPEGGAEALFSALAAQKNSKKTDAAAPFPQKSKEAQAVKNDSDNNGEQESAAQEPLAQPEKKTAPAGKKSRKKNS